MEGTTSQNLHRELMGGNPTQHNTVVGGNIMGEATGTAAAPPAAPASGKQKGARRGSTGWSALKEVVKMFDPEVTTQEFSKKLLKWQADIGGKLTKCATFKTQEVEAANLRVFVGMIKGDAELKLFHSMLKYNNLFVAQNLLGNVIAFMEDSTLEGRPCVFKIPQDKPWAWPEIKFLSNPIEMWTHFSQEGNLHATWNTTGRKNLTTIFFSCLAVVGCSSSR